MKLPTIGPFAVSTLLKAAVNAAVAKHPYGCPYTEWVRRTIESDIDNPRNLDAYTPATLPNTERMQNVAVPLRLSDAINRRVRWLYENPNRNGWYPTSTIEYVRAVLETATGIGAKVPAQIPDRRKQNLSQRSDCPRADSSEKKASR